MGRVPVRGLGLEGWILSSAIHFRVLTEGNGLAVSEVRRLSSLKKENGCAEERIHCQFQRVALTQTPDRS